MAYNVSTLQKYVEEKNLPLLKKSIMAPKTLSIIDIQTGVKSESAMNYLDVDVTFGDGSACGFSAVGDDKFSQRMIKVAPVKVNKEWCDKDLRTKWMGYEVKTAANAKALPFEADIMNQVTEKIADNLDRAIWQGDITSTDANLKQFDGLIKIIKGEADSIKQTITATSLNETNIIKTIKTVYMAMPAELVLDADSKIFCGIDVFRAYQMALVEKNLFHYNGEEAGEFEVIIPGTNMRVVGISGLNGTEVIVGANAKNLVYGTDLEGDNEAFDGWYSQDDRKFKLAVEWLSGVQVRFPGEIVIASKA